MGAGVGGRIWVAWADNGKSVVHAARSNVKGTAFGAVATVAYPASKGGKGTVWQMAIEGSKGPLDIVVNASVPGISGSSMYHTQVLAPLTVSLSKASAKSTTGGSVTVTVTEAGVAVVGAKVALESR